MRAPLQGATTNFSRASGEPTVAQLGETWSPFNQRRSAAEAFAFSRERLSLIDHHAAAPMQGFLQTTIWHAAPDAGADAYADAYAYMAMLMPTLIHMMIPMMQTKLQCAVYREKLRLKAKAKKKIDSWINQL